MGCTVEEMLSRVSSRELSEWMAYYQLEPFGDERLQRQELLLGQMLTLLANVNRKPHSRAYRIEEFMPWLQAAQPRRQSLEEQLAMAETLNALLGGEDLRG